jgi:hypothetical protein
VNLQEQGQRRVDTGGSFDNLFEGNDEPANPNEIDMDDIQKRLHKLEVSNKWGHQTFTQQL